MDNECKIHLSEGAPLKSECSTNIIVNTGKQTKVSAGGGTVINLKSDNSTPHDVGLHINTTLEVTSSKKMKMLLMLNFMLSVCSIVVCCSIALYYWSEMTAMRRQLEVINDQLATHNPRLPVLNPAVSSPDHGLASPLVLTRPFAKESSYEEPRRAELGRSLNNNNSAKKYYVEDLEQDLHFTNSNYKKIEVDAVKDESAPKQGLLVAHFVGGGLERNLYKESAIGPWITDFPSSSKDFARSLELTEAKFVKVHEGGIYLIYAQVVYVSNAPNCFFMWAQKSPETPRLLTTCASGDVTMPRSLRNSQISCSIQTVARLYSGDLINFSQREKNSTVSLITGASYFGFVKLSS